MTTKPSEIDTPGAATTFGRATTRADTLADRRSYLVDGLAPVSCETCGTEVLVRKNSTKHTSIQWTTDPARSCPIYAEQVSRGENTALLDTCERLTESIARAVEAGRIRVGSPEEGAS
ncbi:hypothetical protein SAMN06265360_110162 [Haloechinothrix alba]|uniref:Uncharacterized protein n=1 Tax=Haloechinothrix alba TaxID=664784 RepID=A0A238XG00_9PSEU|nr:hypothetical protein SAMN06265360_110162 [Haloechinothrix alba]